MSFGGRIDGRGLKPAAFDHALGDEAREQLVGERVGCTVSANS
jgi:hypothetical protein